MFAKNNSLWLVRANPENINRLREFIKNDVIAIGWMKLGNLSGKNKNEIVAYLSQNGYSTSNVTVGVINHFVNNLKVGDLCLIPDDEKIYVAEVKSDYFYNSNKEAEMYPHQRKVKILNENKPIDRYELPEDIQKSLGARNTVANLSHRLDLFKKFINKENINNQVDDLEARLRQLLPKALENLQKDIDSDDPTRRFNASIEVIKLIQNFK